MRLNSNGKLAFLVMALITVFPIFAFGQLPQEKPPQAPKIAEPSTPPEIPSTLIDVQYRKCPIKGYKASVKYSAIYEGKVYHFCCGHCVKKFNDNPQAIVSKLKDTKEVPLIVTNKDGKCPVSGKPASTKYFRIHGDKITFYCCPDCPGKEQKTKEPASTETKKTDEKSKK
ncbi:MAG: YHS domain-containing protein [Candidatus Riflebacteria bacterium]|nr:YHS domain-containing protein [Candidatus Riflebacteria bacterium]